MQISSVFCWMSPTLIEGNHDVNLVTRPSNVCCGLGYDTAAAERPKVVASRPQRYLAGPNEVR